MLESQTLFSVAAVAVFSGALGGLLWYFLLTTTNRQPPSTTSPKKPQQQEQTNKQQQTQPTIFIYYGSQTGTAECFARTLERELEDKPPFPTIQITDLEDFDNQEFVTHNWVIFIVATYGEGEPTDNATDANKWLISNQREPNCLAGIRYTVFGLGNRQYTQFNEMGKRIERHMNRLGATQFHPRGEGDDDQDIEKDFDEWKRLLYPALQTAWNAATTAPTINQEDGLLPLLHTWRDNKHAPLELEMSSCPFDLSSSSRGTTALVRVNITSKMYLHSSKAKLTLVKEIRQKAIQGLSTCHVEVDLTGTNLTYNTADNLDVLPQNSDQLVDWFAAKLQDLPSIDHYIHFVPRNVQPSVRQSENNKRPFLTPCTAREALTFYCDLVSLPHKSVLKDLLCFMHDERERNALGRLLAEEQADVFKTLVKDSGMRLFEYVELLMTSARFNIAGFLQLVPSLQFRPYTIASSSKVSPNVVALAVSRVSEVLPTLAPAIEELRSLGYIPLLSSTKLDEIKSRSRHFHGVCSCFLCSLAPSSTTPATGRVSSSAESCLSSADPTFNSMSTTHLRVLVKPSSFFLPECTQTPILMVATGTGVAPFRGFLHECSLDEADTSRRTTVLFFGCTSATKDWIYRDEMEGFLKRKILTHLFCAFSRDQTTKVYVQDLIREQHDLVWELLQKGAFLYICGGMQMGHSVDQTVHDIARIHNAPEHYVQQLRTDKRIVEELWS